MKTLGIVGFGQFGQFMAGHLTGYFEVRAFDPEVKTGSFEDVSMIDLQTVLSSDVIVLAIPAHRHQDFWNDAANLVNPQALLVDVSSVKVNPLRLMVQHAPVSCQIVGIHPMFGPQSGKDGIAGLNAALIAERVSDELLVMIRRFLADTLQLQVHEMTAEEHDQEMAYVQALTFFIGKGLGKLDIPKERLMTKTYQHLLDIKRIVAGDTDELYKSIQTTNPYAKNIRSEFVKILETLDEN